MNRRPKVALVVSLAAWSVLGPGTVTAQTHDEARLSMGISAGWIGAESLWDVPDQPIISFVPGLEPDTFHLHRAMRSGVSVSGHVTYYGRPQFGLTGEFTFLGLGADNGCSVVHSNGNAEMITACQAVAGNTGSASTVAIEGGAVFRPLPRAAVQPYLEGAVGFAFTPSSTVRMTGPYVSNDSAFQLTIYDDNSWKQIRPAWTAVFGIVTAPSQGYQMRFEFRETWMSLTAVSHATTEQGFEPGADPGAGGSVHSIIKGFPSILVGFDVVLARQRGRRY